MIFSLVFFVVFNTPISAAAIIVERVSVDNSGIQGDAGSIDISISEDGRYVAFNSLASNLVPGDTNGASDAFVYDRQTDVIERVSVDSLGAEASSVVYGGISISSSDGRYVSFSSVATNLVAGDSNGVEDVFVYDRNTDTVERVSLSSAGVQGGGASDLPSISADGRYVAFRSFATNLVAGDTNGKADIFVYDRNTDTIERVSLSSAGAQSNQHSLLPVITSDGRYVAFESTSDNLVPGHTNGQFDIFVYDRNADTIEVVSDDYLGSQSNNVSLNPQVSSDGTYTVFQSFASDIVSDDTNSTIDIFVYDRNTDTTERVSLSSAGVQGNGPSTIPTISQDGRYVSFLSAASNLVSDDTNGVADIFVFDRQTDTIERVNISSSGEEANAISDKNFISGDGQYISYVSSATNLVSDDTNGADDVFVAEIVFNEDPTDISLSPSSISENENSGTNIGNLTATDADAGDTHTFTFSCTTPGADDGSFSISGDLLIAEETFDFETKSSYAICVRATDSENATYDENITITINDLDESSGGGGGGGGPGPSDSGDDPTPDPEPDPTPVPTPDPEPTPDSAPEPIPEPEPAPEPDPLPEPTPEPDPAPGPLDDAGPSEESEPRDSNSPFGDVKGAIEHEFELIKLGLQEETPNDIANTVSVAGVALPTIAFVVAQPAVAANLISIPIRLWNLIPIWLGLRRRKRPWGTVYDSVTKQPLDPVYVSLRSLNGREVATTITDMDGRFGFLVPPGRYKIVARKDNYDFPSKKLGGQQSDQLYGNLYDGSEIEISGEENILIKNVPMDSGSFNWNEFQKSENKQLMKFYSKREIFLAHIAGVAFWGGLVSSLVLLVTGPSTLNYILLGVYAAVFILRLFGVKPKKPGYVSEAGSGFPLSFGLVKVYSKALKKEIAHAIIGKTGKYYVLVPNGEYYVKIEKKIGEDEYKEIYTSETFRVKKGFIGQNFEV